MTKRLHPHIGNMIGEKESKYPLVSIIVAMLLLYMAPFITDWLAAGAFVICIYRLIRYDVRVFAVDYCLLAPLSSLSAISGGVALITYLSLLAGIWYLVRGTIRSEPLYVALIVVANYMVLRMQLDINAFVLCFGQMFVLCVLLPKQDEDSAERAVKGYCISLLLSSLYAFLLRDTWQIRALRGPESVAIYGTRIMRFQGLMLDPNYYMTTTLIGLALVLKLKDSNRIGKLTFFITGLGMAAFGIASYSKTFLIVLVLLGCIYIIWQYWSKKYVQGIILTLTAVAALFVLVTVNNSPFEVIIARLRQAENMSDFTTGRTDVYVQYLKEITATPVAFFFGKGMAADALYKDPHNIYIEISYYTGVIGLSVILSFYIVLAKKMNSITSQMVKQNIFAKYFVLIILAILYFTLHGMYEATLYAGLFVAYLAMLLTPKKQMELTSGGK